MKRIALCLAIVVALAACPKSSEASDLTEILRIAFGANHHHYRHAAQQPHVQHHVVHQAAHQQPLTYGQPYAPPAFAPRPFVPRVLPPQTVQGFRGAPAGYGLQYGAAQYQPSPYDNRVGCSPYGRY